MNKIRWKIMLTLTLKAIFKNVIDMFVRNVQPKDKNKPSSISDPKNRSPKYYLANKKHKSISSSANFVYGRVVVFVAERL